MTKIIKPAKLNWKELISSLIYITIRSRIYKRTSKCTMFNHPSNLPSKLDMILSIATQLLLQLDHQSCTFYLSNCIIQFRLMKCSGLFLKKHSRLYIKVPPDFVLFVFQLHPQLQVHSQRMYKFCLQAILICCNTSTIKYIVTCKKKQKQKRNSNFKCLTRGTVR